MAWQVYDAFEGSWSRTGTVYGPLPCKRWVPDGKRYKLQHKVIPAYRDSRDAEQKRTVDLARAIEYARWLALRDGITIPDDCVGMPITELVAVPDLKRGELRVSEVRFVRRHPNKRVDPSDVRAVVKIPHWDWVPAAPVEETEETEMEFRLAAS